MIKREERDTRSGDSSVIGTIKQLSNDVVFGFFTDDKLVEIVTNLYNIALDGEKDSDRISASKEILDRVLGKPKQTIEGKLETSVPHVDDNRLIEILDKYNVINRLNNTTKKGSN